MCRADTANSLTDSYGTSLYSIPEIGYTRDAFRKTVANAQKHGVFDVVPWLALGCGFQRTVKNGNGGFGDGTTTLNFDWNYEYICERATNGIGRATAKALVEQGAELFILCRNEEKGQAFGCFPAAQ